LDVKKAMDEVFSGGSSGEGAGSGGGGGGEGGGVILLLTRSGPVRPGPGVSAACVWLEWMLLRAVRVRRC
jgi:hypothetical protein